jgi:hypothetical protein
MRRPTSLMSRACVLAALALAVCTTPLSAQVFPGARPEFEWGSSLLNGKGTSKLSDLQGKLTWVEFWGTR